MTGSRVVDNVFTSTLRDGATVQVRRLEPADIDAVSRYMTRSAIANAT
jgi:hypothetical protein